MTTGFRSAPLVLATLLRQWQDLSFLTSGIPIWPFQVEFRIFTDASTQSRASTWGFPRFWVFGPAQHINVLELKAVILTLQHWVSVLQGHDVMIATDNTTVVAYINKQRGNKQGGTHSHALLRLVVDLFL